MIGVTLRSGKEYDSISNEAIRRFKKHTGIQTVIVIDTDKTGRNVYLSKLRLHTFFQQTFVFFDADFWFVNDCDLSKFENSEKFYAVKDVGRNSHADFPIHDSHTTWIDPNNYFNSGFFIANGANEAHRSMFEYSCHVAKTTKVFDFGEQTFLNVAVQRFKLPIEFLPYEYNYAIICDQQNYRKVEHEYMEKPIAIHALGYKGKDKERYLKSYIKSQKKHELSMSKLPA